MCSVETPQPGCSINVGPVWSFFPVPTTQTDRNDPARVIVHISHPIVVNKVMEIHTKPANMRQDPTIASVKFFFSKNTIDKVGDLRFHSAYRLPLNHIFSHMSIFLGQELPPSN